MDISNAVYLVTDRQTTGAGVPAVIRGLYEKSARIAIEREEGIKTFDVPLWAYRAGVHCGDPASLLFGLGNFESARENSGLVAGSGPGQGVRQRRPRTKHRRDVREPLLGCGLERQESPLRLAESGPVVLSPKSMKAIPREAARSVGWGKKLCTVPRGSQTSQKRRSSEANAGEKSDWLQAGAAVAGYGTPNQGVPGR
jgi:hypothetical protein